MSSIVHALLSVWPFLGVSLGFLDHSNCELLFNLHNKSAHYVLCSISVWLSVTIFLTTLNTLSVSALTGKQICTALSSSGEVLVFW